MSWNDWALGVLSGVQAPATEVNRTSLWNWSNAESGSDVMRWNNPLNTELACCGGTDANAAGVKRYPTVADGITATVSTLTNGLYGNIVGALRTSLSHNQWGTPAICQDLNRWGTGCGWVTDTLIPPGGDPMPPEVLDTAVREWFLLLLGRPVGETGNPSEFTNWRTQLLPDGSNYGAVFLDLFNQPEAVAYRASGGKPGPQGPPGPKGDTGPMGPEGPAGIASGASFQATVK